MDIRCLIVDDEPPAREELAYIIGQCAGCRVIGQAGSKAVTLNQVQKKQPDVVFLDIEMPGQNGLETLRELNGLPDPPLVVLATAFDNHAVSAFELGALDYILKPFDVSRVRKTLQRVQSRLHKGVKTDQESGLFRVGVESHGGIRLLAPTEIVFFASEDKRVYAFTFAERYRVQAGTSLDSLEERLGADNFLRTHRAYLVNLAWIRQYAPWENGRYSLQMANSSQTHLPVARSRVAQFKTLLGLL